MPGEWRSRPTGVLGEDSPATTADQIAYTSQDILDAETRLLRLSDTKSAPALSDRLVADLLVGPAGAGKTTALRALHRAWTAAYGRDSVIGLAPSAVAAEVLGDSLGVKAENTAASIVWPSRPTSLDPAEVDCVFKQWGDLLLG